MERAQSTRSGLSHGHRSNGVGRAIATGSGAVRQLVDLRRQRIRLKLERTVLVGAAGAVSIVAVGAALGGAGILIVIGIAQWTATALALPAWAPPLVAGVMLAVSVVFAVRRFARHWAFADDSSERPADRDPGSEGALIDAERTAASTLTKSAEEVARALTSPIGLLLTAGCGFAAYRALRRHPLVGSAVMGLMGLARRVFGAR